MTPMALLESFWTSIPAWLLAALALGAALSFAVRFRALRRGQFFARPWQSIGLAGALLGIALFYIVLTFGETDLSVAFRGGSIRLLLLILCLGLLHFNLDYIRWTLREARRKWIGN